jgi:hypothetical protein
MSGGTALVQVTTNAIYCDPKYGEETAPKG